MAKQLTLEAAERVISACKKRAEEIGTPMCVSADDGGANPDEHGRVVGGVGVSGGSPEHDVAAAGAAAF
jgi:uncharacterized protein GlcG (DUF336 family)